MSVLVHNVLAVEAQSLLQAIEKAAASTVSDEKSLFRGFARLACLLSMFKKKECWRHTGYDSFNSYIRHIADTYGREPETLYQHITVAEKLLPLIGEAGLEKMGVSKARLLLSATRQAGKDTVHEALITAALDDEVGVKQLRALAHELYELKPGDMPKGVFVDLGGIYLEEHELKSFEACVQMTSRLLDLPADMRKQAKLARCLLAWSDEFNTTYQSEVYGAESATR